MADIPTLRAKVEAAQALAAKATRGPWRSAGDCQSGGLDYVHVEVPIRPEQNVSEAILATIKRYGAHKEKAEGNADLMAAAPDLVTLATDLLVALEAAQTDDRAYALVQIGDALLRLQNEAGWTEAPTHLPDAVSQLVRDRDEARAELTAIRAALGNGADEAAWPPGMTLAEAVGRLREAWRKAEPAPLCDQCVSVREEAGWVVARHCTLPAGHEGPHAEALGDNGGSNG